MEKMQNARLSEILPESLLEDEKIAAFAAAIDKMLSEVTSAAEETIHIPRLDKLSGEILDLLAYQLHVDQYEPLWLKDAVKRNLIRQSIATHRRKGTRAAVEAVNAAINRAIKIQEWYEYGGEPYYFRLTTEPFKSNDDLQAWIRQVDAVKNVRSWLEVQFEREIETPAYVGIARWIHGKITRQMTSNYDVGRTTTTVVDGDRTLIISPTQVIIKYGADEEVISLGSLFGDLLKMRFTFPSSERLITIENPREDLTPEEVQEVADYAIENEIILNDAQETVSTIKRATLVTTTTQVLF